MSWHEREPASQLPVPLTPFIGRARESAAAIDLLRSDEVRLLTLTGPGGAGKSRLALHVASELNEEIPDGMVFVDLSPVRDSDLVLPTIANSYGIRDTNGQSAAQVLTALLLNQRKLLVLDNFEQVVDAGPDLANLLACCSNLKILVTSQVPLHIQGEQELPIPPLELPPRGVGTIWTAPSLDEIAQYDAVILFCQRAHNAQPDFALTEENVLAVVEICRRLDGLPLAIELAAARIKLLSPSALLSRLASRLAILTSGSRDLPPRLQTMRAAIDWSYNLLDPSEQAVFRRLAVFSGGFTLEAATAVCDQGDLEIDIFDGVASLVDKSLLRPADSSSDEPRFMMLETIREYGGEQLEAHGMTSTIRQQHARWYAALVRETSREITRREAVLWMNRLETEHDNIRAALAWLLDNGDAETALRMTGELWFFWFQRSYYTEGRAWLERALAQRPARPTPAVATALCFAGIFAQPAGDFDSAIERLEESRATAMALGDKSSLALATLGLADVHNNLEDRERAGSLYEEAAILFRETGAMTWLAMTLTYLGVHAHRDGDEARSERLISEALEISNREGFIWGSAMALNRSGRVAADSGDFARATECYLQSLDLWHALGDRWRVGRVLVDLADVAAHTNAAERAVRLLAAADALNEPFAYAFQFSDDAARKRAIELARKHLDQPAFEAAWADGWSRSWDETIRSMVGEENVPPPAPAPHVDVAHHLTARELEVLQLLVAGHSDRQIAEELFISPRTAQSHVASIFTKLGVNSRTAAATAAIRAGLAPESGTPIT